MGRGSIRDLLHLPAQLEGFSLQDAECFCCKHDHIHPNTQRRIPCDREKIYRTIEMWFNGDNGDTWADNDNLVGISRCSQKIRELGNQFLKVASPTQISYSYAF